jgi:hypothetical protein
LLRTALAPVVTNFAPSCMPSSTSNCSLFSIPSFSGTNAARSLSFGTQTPRLFA